MLILPLLQCVASHQLSCLATLLAPKTGCQCADMLCRNEILLCDGEGCDVAVHQSCYAVARLPRGKWYCDACKDKLDLAKPNCVCCPVLGGPLRKVAAASHALCFLVHSQSLHALISLEDVAASCAQCWKAICTCYI